MAPGWAADCADRPVGYVQRIYERRFGNGASRGIARIKLESAMRQLLVLIFCAVVSVAAPQSIRGVDWKNFSYPLLETDRVPDAVRWLPPSTKKSSSLINGRYIVPCGIDKRSCPSVTFDSVNYGMLNGIESSIAAVVLTYHSGGTANWQYLYLYAFESSKPRLLAWLRTGSRGAQGLRDVSFTGGELVLAVNDPDQQQGDCCSAGSITTRYRWLEDSFSAIGQPVHKPDPPSFDCTKAATPVERLICQDAGLSFLDRQLAESYRTVLKGASAERKQIIRQQQAEWFADYKRTCNAPLSETQRHDCIDRYLSERLVTVWK
jgi:uncharacterized protein YecT (DUF1311 family)